MSIITVESGQGALVWNGAEFTHTLSLDAGSSNVISVALAGSLSNAVTVTYNGVALTPQVTVNDGDAGDVQIHDLLSPATGVNDLVFSSGGAADISYTATAMAGVDLASPRGTPVTDGTYGASTISNTFTTIAGDMIVDVLSLVDVGSAAIGAAPQTVRLNGSTQNAGFLAYSSTHEAVGVSTNNSWTLTGATRVAYAAQPYNFAGSPSITIDSTDAEMQRSTDFSHVVSNAAVAPTPANTTLSSGNDSLVPAVTGSGPWTLTYPVGDLSKQVDGTGYVWTLNIAGETVDTSAIPLTIQAGWSKTDLVDPVFTLTSALRDYTGDAAVTDDDLEVGPITGLGAGMSIAFLPDGRYNIEDPSGTWVDDIAFPRRVIRADGVIGTTETKTIEADAVVAFLPIFARFNNQLIGGM